MLLKEDFSVLRDSCKNFNASSDIVNQITKSMNQYSTQGEVIGLGFLIERNNVKIVTK